MPIDAADSANPSNPAGTAGTSGAQGSASDHRDNPHQTLRKELSAGLNAASLRTLSGRIELSWDENNRASNLRFAIRDGTFEWLPADATVDVTFYFDDETALRRVLGGEDNPMDHFMRGDFRSSGYLLWTFPLLTLFRGSA